MAKKKKVRPADQIYQIQECVKTLLGTSYGAKERSKEEKMFIIAEVLRAVDIYPFEITTFREQHPEFYAL